MAASVIRVSVLLLEKGIYQYINSKQAFTKKFTGIYIQDVVPYWFSFIFIFHSCSHNPRNNTKFRALKHSYFDTAKLYAHHQSLLKLFFPISSALCTKNNLPFFFFPYDIIPSIFLCAPIDSLLHLPWLPQFLVEEKQIFSYFLNVS